MAEASELSLDTYVEQTLVQIFNGIVRANQGIAETNSTKENTFGLSPGQEPEKGQGVEFDLSLAIRKATGGWSVKVVNVSLDRAKTGESEFASRVKFTVSVDRWVREGAVPVDASAATTHAGGAAQREQQRQQQELQQQQ
jgi:hypothetical protein